MSHITIEEFLDITDMIVKEFHDEALTLSRETNFLSAMDDVVGYANRNNIQHYLDEEVFIKHTERLLVKARRGDADVRMYGMKNIPNTKYFYNNCQ